MEPFNLFVFVAALVVLALQGWLTARVWKSSLFDRRQKLAQSQLIWLLPLIGGIIVFCTQLDIDREDKTSRGESHVEQPRG